jgi:hypothetical protein
MSDTQFNEVLATTRSGTVPLQVECLSWIKTGKSRSEQLFSDLPPKADLTADIVDVSQVP